MLSSSNVQYVLFCLLLLSARMPASVGLLPLTIYAARQVAMAVPFVPGARWVAANDASLARSAVLGELFTVFNFVIAAVLLRSLLAVSNAFVMVMWLRSRFRMSEVTRTALREIDATITAATSRIPLIGRLYTSFVSLLSRIMP
jgi:hypothetical protein